MMREQDLRKARLAPCVGSLPVYPEIWAFLIRWTVAFYPTEQLPERNQRRRNGLGLVAVADVGAVVKEFYPQGTAGITEGEVLRAVFLHLQSQSPTIIRRHD